MFDIRWLRSGQPGDGRRKLSNEDQPWYERYRRAIGWPLVVAVGFWALASLIISTGDEPLPYEVGQELQQPVISRVAFEQKSEFRTDEARRQAQQAVPNFYRLNTNLIERIKANIRALYADAKAAESFEVFQKAHKDQWDIDQAGFDALRNKDAENAPLTDYLTNLELALKGQHLIERASVDRPFSSTAESAMMETTVGIFQPVVTEMLDYATNKQNVENLAEDVVRNIFPKDIQATIASIIRKAIAPGNEKYEPVYVYDAELTKKRIEEAGKVTPVFDKFEAGDRLAAPGKINEETFALLRTEHNQFLEQRDTNPVLAAEWQKRRFGMMGIVALTTIGLSIFAYRTQPRIVKRTLRALGLAVLLIGMLAFDRFVLLNVGKSPMWSVATVTITAAVLTITYSQLFALGAASALALLTVLALNAPYGLMILLLSVATVTVLMLKEIRTRMHMVRVGIVTAFAAALAAAFTSFAEGDPVFTESFLAALAAVIGIGIVFVLLPLIERGFKVSTSLTLLEWADTSKPLLRQLIEKAPGTWQHSHLLGSMAETAAQVIGANGLLVRVGAYYHDIGKTCKPNYFVENQDANISAHRGLAPSMSLLVILSHVKDGLALARDHGVPPILHQFIAEHHGTTVVRYFHHMASEEAKASGLKMREVSDTDFRYPGPRPRSRESAILMLCDGVEGAVRSLQEPTPGRIETVVHDILMARLMDGQFDECDITLRELALVERSLVKSLRAIHHGRIAYPKDSSDAGKPKVKSA